MGGLLCLSLSAAVPYAQQLTNAGREFYIGMPVPSILSDNLPILANGKTIASGYAAKMFLMSDAEDTVNISYFASDGSEHLASHLAVHPGHARIVPLDSSQVLSSRVGEIAEYRTCHITSQTPLTVMVYSEGSGAGGAYLALPRSALGKEYVVCTYPHAIEEPSSNIFEIIATSDSTHITVVPVATTQRRHTGVLCGDSATGSYHPFSIVLSRGQSYTVRIQSGLYCSEAGSSVVADKPIVVIAAHGAATTSGSDMNTGFESTNFMIEQLVPRMCFDSAGYIAVPFVEPGTIHAGMGDEVVSYTGAIGMIDPVDSTNTVVSHTNGFYTQTLVSYTAGASTPVTIGSNEEFYSTNGHPISVMQFDQRSQTSAPPYTAPEMMTIVPMSQWTNRYTVCVPTNQYDSLGTDYINIIGSRSAYLGDSILVSIDGGGWQSLRTAFAMQLASVKTLNMSNLFSAQIRLSPGTYRFVEGRGLRPDTGGSAFMVYSYGMRYYNPYGAFIDRNGITRFYEYAAPAGMTLRSLRAGQSRLHVSVRRDCIPWTVCVHDSGGPNNGIRFVEIRSTQQQQDGTWKYVRPEIAFDNSVDPMQLGEIVLSGTDTDYCFAVKPLHSHDSGSALIAVYDNSGACVYVDLSAPLLSLKAQAPFHTRGNNQGFDAGALPLDSERCATVYLVNPPGSNEDVPIDYVGMSDPGRNYSLQKIPKLPITLHPADTLRLDICFHPHDTGSINEEIILRTPCDAFYRYTLTGVGATGILQVDDIAFGPVSVGATECRQVVLRNVGTQVLHIVRGDLSDTNNFSVDSTATSWVYPMPIRPGTYITATLCYHPQSSDAHEATMDWRTDVSGDARALGKQSTTLSADAVSGVVGQATPSDPERISAWIAHGHLTIIRSGNAESDCQLDLFDVLGRRIASWEIRGGEHRVVESIPALSGGEYIVRMTDRGIVSSCFVRASE